MCRYKTKKVLFFSSILILITILFSSPVYSAMDPAEIKKRNSEAPYRIIGKVSEDTLFIDLSQEKNEHYQIRKMTIIIDEIIKNPTSIKKSIHSIDVYYTYIPLWRAREYTGGKFMDITVNDVIEIWLEEGNYGWEPVVSGDSVRHIEYVENRNEPIAEPPLDFLERKVESRIEHNPNSIVITGIIFTIFILCYIGLRKR